MNSSLFILCNWALYHWGVYGHYGITRAASSAVMLALVGWLAWWQRPGLARRPWGGMEGLIAATFTAMAGYLLVGAPTPPWYAIWSLPLLCWWAIPGWVLLSLTVSAQYYLRSLYPGNDGAYHALLWAGYLPVYTLLIGQLIWARVGARARPHGDLLSSSNRTG